jgi:hypothetical protein
VKTDCWFKNPLYIHIVFNFVFMRKWDFQATSQEKLISCSREIKESVGLKDLEEVRGSLCLGDCLSRSGEGEGRIRKPWHSVSLRDQGRTAGVSRRRQGGGPAQHQGVFQSHVNKSQGLAGAKNGFLWTEKVLPANSANMSEDLLASQCASLECDWIQHLPNSKGRQESMSSEVCKDRVW